MDLDLGYFLKISYTLSFQHSQTLFYNKSGGMKFLRGTEISKSQITNYRKGIALRLMSLFKLPCCPTEDRIVFSSGGLEVGIYTNCLVFVLFFFCFVL